MTVREGTHIRSLRMPRELAEAVTAAAGKLKIPENRFICQAVVYVCEQSGIPVARPADGELDEDPFA